MSGRTVRDVFIRLLDRCDRSEAGSLCREELGIDPDTDLDTHVLVAHPKCETCRGSRAIADPDDWREVLRSGGPECPECDGRGWRMP